MQVPLLVRPRVAELMTSPPVVYFAGHRLVPLVAVGRSVCTINSAAVLVASHFFADLIVRSDRVLRPARIVTRDAVVSTDAPRSLDVSVISFHSNTL